MDKKQQVEKVGKTLVFLAALYPKFDLTEATIKAYTVILGDLPGDVLQAAAQDIGSRSTFFPAAAEIRTAAMDLMQQAQEIPSPYEAWQQVKSQFAGRRLEMHPLAEQAINSLGGLRAFGNSQESQEASWRARFVDAYEILVRRQERDRAMLPAVAGQVERLKLSAGGKANGDVQRAIAATAGALRNGHHD